MESLGVLFICFLLLRPGSCLQNLLYSHDNLNKNLSVLHYSLSVLKEMLAN